MTKFITLIVSLLFTFAAFAQEVVEALPGEGLVAKILEFINSGSGAMVIAVVLEFALRFIKSEKPLSILYVVAGMLKMVGNLFAKLGDFMDKVLPQKIK